MKQFKRLISLFLFIILIPLLVLSYQLLGMRIYNFPEPTPFKGESFYNPYNKSENLKWYKCNFHAHAIAYSGLSNGKQPGKTVYLKYKSMGYDVACISDYHRINPEQNLGDTNFIPAYEHGYNITKAHRIVLGTTDVNIDDIFVHLTTSSRQFILEIIGRNAKAITLAHPKFMNGHRLEDFIYLTGYNFVEVLNHFRVSDEHWDAALTAGKAVWAVGSDDTHDVENDGETGVMWTMVNSSSTHRDSILKYMKLGNCYAVRGYQGRLENRLVKQELINDTLNVLFAKKFDSLVVIGNYGNVVKTIKNTNKIEYIIQPEDNYVRIEAHNCKNKFGIYLNPIVRYNGVKIPSNEMQATENYFYTWMMRLGISILALVISYLIFLHNYRW